MPSGLRLTSYSYFHCLLQKGWFTVSVHAVVCLSVVCMLVGAFPLCTYWWVSSPCVHYWVPSSCVRAGGYLPLVTMLVGVSPLCACWWVPPSCVYAGGCLPPVCMLMGVSLCVHVGGSFLLCAFWWVLPPCVHADGCLLPVVCCCVWQVVQGLKAYSQLLFTFSADRLVQCIGWSCVSTVCVGLLCLYLFVLALFIFCRQVGPESHLIM